MKILLQKQWAYDKGGWISPTQHDPLVHIGRRITSTFTGIAPFNFFPVFRVFIGMQKCAVCGIPTANYFELCFQFTSFDLSYESLKCHAIHKKPATTEETALPRPVSQVTGSGKPISAVNVTKKQ
jgi:hypothetical protein